MNITKPIAFFDLETTGVDATQARIAEIAIVKLNVDGSRERLHKYVNPGIPMPKDAEEVNGLSTEFLSDKPKLLEVLPEVLSFIGDADLGGYNIRYDITCLSTEAERVGLSFEWRKRKLFDGFRVFIDREPRSLTAACKKYLNKELEDAHQAMADTEASLDVLLAQMEYYNLTEEEVVNISTKGLLDLGGYSRILKMKSFSLKESMSIDLLERF